MKKLILTAFFIVFLSQTSLAQVDYTDSIQSIFNSNCTSCHGSGGLNGVSLVNYEAVMNSTGFQYGIKIVVPEEPDESPLVDKIEPDPQHGDRMPQDGPPYLTEEEIELIRQWISEGALEEVATSAEITRLPEAFELIGNYPNPFNPSTVIQFNVPVSASYQISIYSVDGRKLLVYEGFASAGTNNVRVELNDLPSGSYLYNIELPGSNDQTGKLTGRMTLIK